MFKVDLKKQIENSHKSSQVDSEKMLEQVQKQLSFESAADREILRSMGMDRSLKVAEEKQSENIVLKADRDKFSKNAVLTEDEIKEIALKYNLRFLCSDSYKGYIEANLPVVIRNFAEENGIDLNSYTLQYKFYVLAPADSFKLQKKPRSVDPILFYRVERHGISNYVVVHKWGNDLTLANLVEGMFTKSARSYTLACAALILGIFFGVTQATEVYPIWLFVVLGILTISFGFAGADNENDRDWNKSKWNSTYE